MSAQHIPGPYVADINGHELGANILDSDGFCVANCVPDCAALIAAVPDLLAALKTLLSRHTALVECGDCGNWDVETEEEVIQARAAIAKAVQS